jgi:predicted O-methyltransferase YrrM
MRRVQHLTPLYLRDRVALWIYHRRHPDAPWLTAEAIRLLNSILRPADRGLEFGAWRSTLWLAERTASLQSIETAPAWHRSVSTALTRRGMTHVECVLIPADEARIDDPYRAEYLTVAHRFAPGSVDYVLVDAIYRGECALQSAALLKPGGLLVVDNVERYLPNSTRSPERLRREASPVWQAFRQHVAGWRCAWTSNGVWDTAIWFKPS